MIYSLIYSNSPCKVMVYHVRAVQCVLIKGMVIILFIANHNYNVLFTIFPAKNRGIPTYRYLRCLEGSSGPTAGTEPVFVNICWKVS